MERSIIIIISQIITLLKLDQNKNNCNKECEE